MTIRSFRSALLAHLAVLGACGGMAFGAQNLRVVTWNIESDVAAGSGSTTSLNAGTDAVLQAIGVYTIGGIAQAADILALQETSYNTTSKVDQTASLIAAGLTSDYASSSHAVYLAAAVPAGSSTSGLGNGPNAMVYNSSTLQLLQATAVGVGATGVNRPVMRYEFAPADGTAAQAFYVYVSHMKSSGSDSGSDLVKDATERQEEAVVIRQDEAALPSDASVLYMGDFNMSGTTSAEPGYQTLTRPTAAGISSQGAAVDPLNPANDYTQTWDKNSAFAGELTESAKALNYRDDAQFMTSNVYNGTGALRYVQGSYTVFGNGNVTVRHSVNTAANAAATGISTTILGDLTTASDHLPVLVQYTITAVPEPGTLMVLSGTLAMAGMRRRCGA